MKEEPEIFLHGDGITTHRAFKTSDLGKSTVSKWTGEDYNRLEYKHRWPDGRTETGSMKFQAPSGIGSLRELEDSHALENEAYRQNMEAAAWETWKLNWTPSIRDYIVMFFHRPTAAYHHRLESSDLCRIRYLEHRAKHPFA